MTTDEDGFNAVSAVAESSIHLDSQFKKDLFSSLKDNDQYCELIQKLEDRDQPNEIIVNYKVFRIKQGTLKVREKDQKNATNYWECWFPTRYV